MSGHHHHSHHHHHNHYQEEHSQQQQQQQQPTPRKKRRGMIEKKRRDKINNSLMELRRLVPAAFEKSGVTKLEKAEILQMTVDYLRYLHAQGIVGDGKLVPKQELLAGSSSSSSSQSSVASADDTTTTTTTVVTSAASDRISSTPTCDSLAGQPFAGQPQSALEVAPMAGQDYLHRSAPVQGGGMSHLYGHHHHHHHPHHHMSTAAAAVAAAEQAAATYHQLAAAEHMASPAAGAVQVHGQAHGQEMQHYAHPHQHHRLLNLDHHHGHPALGTYAGHHHHHHHQPLSAMSPYLAPGYATPAGSSISTAAESVYGGEQEPSGGRQMLQQQHLTQLQSTATSPAGAEQNANPAQVSSASSPSDNSRHSTATAAGYRQWRPSGTELAY